MLSNPEFERSARQQGRPLPLLAALLGARSTRTLEPCLTQSIPHQSRESVCTRFTAVLAHTGLMRLRSAAELPR
jgi:hypothetical protein